MSISCLKSVNCADSSEVIKKALYRLKSDQEGAVLINTFEDQGAKILIANIGDLETAAKVSLKDKIIWMNPNNLKSEEEVLDNLVFELFNFSQIAKIKDLTYESKSVDELVEGLEKLEYLSAIKTKQLVSKILGPNAEFECKHIPETFKHFYALQQLTGHSERIAKRYRPNEVFRGSFAHPLASLDELAREYLHGLLYCFLRGDMEEGLNFTSLRSAVSTQASSDPTCRLVDDCCKTLFPS